MQILVTYDVSTDTEEGRRRLRRVARICQDYGQRVQKSVFECAVNTVQLEQMTNKLIAVINCMEDSLRIYRLREPKDKYLKVYGVDNAVDFEGPLIL